MGYCGLGSFGLYGYWQNTVAKLCLSIGISVEVYSWGIWGKCLSDELVISVALITSFLSISKELLSKSIIIIYHCN